MKAAPAVGGARKWWWRSEWWQSKSFCLVLNDLAAIGKWLTGCLSLWSFCILIFAAVVFVLFCTSLNRFMHFTSSSSSVFPSIHPGTNLEQAMIFFSFLFSVEQPELVEFIAPPEVEASLRILLRPISSTTVVYVTGSMLLWPVWTPPHPLPCCMFVL